MTMPILKELSHAYIKSLFDEGLMNDQFNEILALKRIGEPDCVVKLIDKYFTNVEKIISELSRHADNPKADFNKLASLAHEVKNKSTSIGAERIRLVCLDVIKTCDEKNQNNFSRIMPLLNNEFYKTWSKLKSFIEMERRIIRREIRSQSTASTSQLATSSSQSSN